LGYKFLLSEPAIGYFSVRSAATHLKPSLGRT
jgi:hypothetical protein